MFHTRAMPRDLTRSHFTALKTDILQRMPDAGDILRYLAQHETQVRFTEPAGLSKIFGKAADAGAVSILDNSIHIDLRKPAAQQADDLARRVRVLMTAPEPNAAERFAHDTMGATYGRFMKLETRDGF